MNCTPNQILLGLSNQEECVVQGLWHVWGRGSYRILMGKLRERDHLGDLGVHRRIT